MDDSHQLFKKFQAIAGALDAELSARERLAVRLAAQPVTPDELRPELQLHEEALAIAAERRRDLEVRRDQAHAVRARAEHDRLEALIAEIDREVPVLEQAIRALRERL